MISISVLENNHCTDPFFTKDDLFHLCIVCSHSHAVMYALTSSTMAQIEVQLNVGNYIQVNLGKDIFSFPRSELDENTYQSISDKLAQIEEDFGAIPEGALEYSDDQNLVKNEIQGFRIAHKDAESYLLEDCQHLQLEIQIVSSGNIVDLAVSRIKKVATSESVALKKSTIPLGESFVIEIV